MSAFNKLMGQLVTARIPEDEDSKELILTGKVINIDINDFYFYEKNEPIYITVNLLPESNVSEEDLEDYIDIPLRYITLN